MPANYNFSRLFTPSAFEAMRIIRIFKSQHPTLLRNELLALIRTIVPDSHDYEAGGYLDEIVEAEFELHEDRGLYRACIEALVSRQAVWIKLIGLGRKKFIQKLERDEERCFEFAGLLTDPPEKPVMEWWDDIAGRLRQIGEREKMRRARAAEQLSLEYEKARLRRLGIDRSPQWIAFDDNTVGYDILSYDRGQFQPVNRLIEVKSTIASPLRFFLSRNEWETAAKFGDRYFFHIWDLRGPQLYERTVKDITLKIPFDNESGRWTHAEIPVS